MGARGRGRGGGRGRGMSFSVEALGFGVGEALPGPVLAPPSLFPTLLNPPVSLRSDNKQNNSFGGCVDWDYCVMVKKSMVDWLWDSSPFAGMLGDNGRSSMHLSDVERYSDRYQFAQLSSNQKDTSRCFQWNRMPMELRKGKKVVKKKIPAKKKESTKAIFKEDITKRLSQLEEMEGVEVGETKEEEGEEAEDGEEKEEEEEEEVEEEDEEMDAGTDYISSYFDNGEGYLDDDDDGDDGPTY